MTPHKAKHECRWTGCHLTTDVKYCQQHERIGKEVERARTNSPQNKLYKTARWRAQRTRVIAKNKGICQICKKPVTKRGDAHVDHIEAVQDTGHFWVRDDQLQLTHKSCHSTKTFQERRDRGERI